MEMESERMATRIIAENRRGVLRDIASVVADLVVKDFILAGVLAEMHTSSQAVFDINRVRRRVF